MVTVVAFYCEPKFLKFGLFPVFIQTKGTLVSYVNVQLVERRLFNFFLAPRVHLDFSVGVAPPFKGGQFF